MADLWSDVRLSRNSTRMLLQDAGIAAIPYHSLNNYGPGVSMTVNKLSNNKNNNGGNKKNVRKPSPGPVKRAVTKRAQTAKPVAKKITPPRSKTAVKRGKTAIPKRTAPKVTPSPKTAAPRRVGYRRGKTVASKASLASDAVGMASDESQTTAAATAEDITPGVSDVSHVTPSRSTVTKPALRRSPRKKVVNHVEDQTAMEVDEAPMEVEYAQSPSSSQSSIPNVVDLLEPTDGIAGENKELINQIINKCKNMSAFKLNRMLQFIENEEEDDDIQVVVMDQEHTIEVIEEDGETDGTSYVVTDPDDEKKVVGQVATINPVNNNNYNMPSQPLIPNDIIDGRVMHKTVYQRPLAAVHANIRSDVSLDNVKVYEAATTYTQRTANGRHQQKTVTKKVIDVNTLTAAQMDALLATNNYTWIPDASVTDVI